MARWKVSWANVVPGDGETLGEGEVVGEGDTVTVGEGETVAEGDTLTEGVGDGGGALVWMASASLLANSSVNQMRF